ncbi:MAG: DUF4340 domain-containing protein [Myxococcota bacterium]
MKKTLLAAIVLGGLLGSYAYLSSRPEKGERARRAPPFSSQPKDRVAKVTIVKDGKKVVLARVDKESFRVAEPVDYPADKYAVKTLLEKLEKLEFGDVVTDQSAKHAEFEVDDAKGVRVTVEDADGKARADFLVGKIAGGYTLVRAAGKNEVVQVVGSIKTTFSKELKAWRDKTIFDFKRDEAERIEVATPGGAYALAGAKEGEKIKWTLASAPLAVDALDEDVPSGIVSSLYALKASDFADNATLETAGLVTPAFAITVKAGGAAHTLLVGGKKDEDFYVKRADKPQIFLLKKYTVDRVAKRPIDLRDKTVASFKEDDVESVEIVKGGDRLRLARKDGAWSSTPETKLDEAKVKSAVAALAMLKASSFSDARDAATTGLGKPQGIVTVRLKDRSNVTVRVGGKTAEDNELYLARDGRPDVFVVKKYTVDRFLKTAADFERKADAPPMPGPGPRPGP